jgi:hypothetical protein
MAARGKAPQAPAEMLLRCSIAEAEEARALESQRLNFQR